MRENRLRFCVETVNTSKAYTLTRLNTKQSVNLLGFGTMKPSDDPGVSKNEFNSRMRWMQSELDNFANEVYLTQSVFEVVLQKSIPTQILYISNSKGQPTGPNPL